MFNKGNVIQNRYLHGPGVDNVIAEEGTHSYTLSSTTVTLDGFGNADLDGQRTVVRDAPPSSPLVTAATTAC